MKKFLALVCTLCLLLTALPLTALAADDDWVTLNVEMYDRSIAGFNVEDCWQLRYIQENFGDPNHIKINWIPVSRWEEGTILSTRLAGGTAPDICMTYGTDLVQQYIDMGGIMPLDDLLAEYGQELTAFLGDEVLQYGQYDVGDGKEQYFLPARRIVVATQSMFIRKDWLDKLNMAEPTTTEEWVAYLRAAKEAKLGEQQDELQGKLDETTKLMNEYAADQKALEQMHAAEEKAADEIDAQIARLIADSDVVPGSEGFIWPVSTSKMISSPIGSRVAPGGFGSTNHKGVDICNVGYTSSVYATKSGRVLLTNSSGWGGGYGNYVVIDHGGGLTTLYAHMSVVKVSPGDTVSQGTVIGVTGNTGASTGPHLHYEVRTTTIVNGKSVTVYQNPLNYLPGYIAAW